MSKRETVWIQGTVVNTTEHAVLINDGKRNAWLPRSAILDTEDDIEKGEKNSFEIPESLAADKDLV